MYDFHPLLHADICKLQKANIVGFWSVLMNSLSLGICLIKGIIIVPNDMIFKVAGLKRWLAERMGDSNPSFSLVFSNLNINKHGELSYQDLSDDI